MNQRIQFHFVKHTKALVAILERLHFSLFLCLSLFHFLLSLSLSLREISVYWENSVYHFSQHSGEEQHQSSSVSPRGFSSFQQIFLINILIQDEKNEKLPHKTDEGYHIQSSVSLSVCLSTLTESPSPALFI